MQTGIIFIKMIGVICVMMGCGEQDWLSGDPVGSALSKCGR